METNVLIVKIDISSVFVLFNVLFKILFAIINWKFFIGYCIYQVPN